MKTMFSFALATAAVLLIVSQAPKAQAASIQDCEKIEAWDAYNKCLATYGRKRGGPIKVDPSGGPSGDGASVRRGRSRSASGGIVQRGRNGRAYAVFDVAPVKQAAPRRGRR